jgi:hypothetical protein
MANRVTVNWRGVRWSLVIIAVAVEIGAFVVWRVRSPNSPGGRRRGAGGFTEDIVGLIFSGVFPSLPEAPAAE